MSKRDAVRPKHPISVVAERTGLTADLLRQWERRYGVVEPARDEGGRRLYSDADIERLRLLSQATLSGRSVGQLVDLPLGKLQELVRSDEAARWTAVRPPTAGGEQAYVARALQRTRAFDAAGLDEELRRAASTLGAVHFLEDVIAPLFRAIGDGWHAGELSIAHEHLASGVARPLLAQLRAALGAPGEAPAIVVATPAGEPHEIGALLVAGAAAAEGWRVVYLGPDTPAAELVRAALETGARAVALSSVYEAETEALTRELRALREAVPADVAILVGGAGTTRLSGGPGVAGIRIMSDLAELREYLRR
ncbi:MAG TPA: cobalamin-dependent protein [Longimicrobiales bacterium]|nr:cobalamin-dependent protein [Longimicrobiales bacterium]